MMSANGMKAAILIANGFLEQDMIAVQRMLQQQGAYTRVISPEQGLVSGWDGAAWGHHYAVDCSLATALGADYDILVIPGGKRSHDKLRLTAHTKRFISSFMQSGKPVCAMDDALGLLIFTDQIRGRTVSGPPAMNDLAIQAGALWKDNTPCIDGVLVTGAVDNENRETYVSAVLDTCRAWWDNDIGVCAA